MAQPLHKDLLTAFAYELARRVSKRQLNRYILFSGITHGANGGTYQPAAQVLTLR